MELFYLWIRSYVLNLVEECDKSGYNFKFLIKIRVRMLWDILTILSYEKKHHREFDKSYFTYHFMIKAYAIFFSSWWILDYIYLRFWYVMVILNGGTNFPAIFMFLFVLWHLYLLFHKTGLQITSVN